MDSFTIELMKLYNTLTRTVEEFSPLNAPSVTMYACGPTVYDYASIGNMRKYVMDDILKRTLTFNGYTVNHVMNITDVGHLSNDDDQGEDKMEKGAKKIGKTVWDVADFYTRFFQDSMKTVKTIPPNITCRATDHIGQMVTLIKELQKKGYTYETEEAVYFDVSKFPSYGKLSGQKLDEKKEGVREDVYIDKGKRNQIDFALWFKRVGRFADHSMHWPSPWGEGFPGWHIECSAMSMHYLGETIDIHTGGIDHIPVHHENEIAQSEGATGKSFVKFWVHHNFLRVDDTKMSKSLGNFYTIEDVKEKGIDPLALRLLFLQSHYRQPLNFTWDAVKGADEALKKLKNQVRALRNQTERTQLSPEKLEKVDSYRNSFKEALSQDLQTPQAVAVMFEMLKSNVPSEDKLDLLFEFDEVLGLDLRSVEDKPEEIIPNEIQELAKKRVELKTNKQYEEADKLRREIEEKGYILEDLPNNSFLIKVKE